MNNVTQTLASVTASDRLSARVLGIFESWRLEAYGYAVAAIYLVLLFSAYRSGAWLVGSQGMPLYSDFTDAWVAGREALRGHTALLYNPAEFVKLKKELVEPASFYFPNWPYPPTYLLLLAPLAMLPQITAFLTWQFATLLGCVAVVHRIVRHRAAIALLLASPFTAWNIFAGQNGFLTASLVGASLLTLERRPVLGGVFIGCLTYKPQFGLLFPVALVAAKQWRAIASATFTALFLAGVSIIAFGTRPWAEFPRELFDQTSLSLGTGPGSEIDPAAWSIVQTVYGLARRLHDSAVLASLAQGIVMSAMAVIVWLVWRAPVRYALKAATLSTAILFAPPCAFAYDLAAIAIPVAFLAMDQIRFGLLRGEQTLLLAMFGVALSLIVARGWLSVGPPILLALLWIILHRALYRTEEVDLRLSSEPRNPFKNS
jgi:arabinofuranan 3-O-arabinosyltransferase